MLEIRGLAQSLHRVALRVGCHQRELRFLLIREPPGASSSPEFKDPKSEYAQRAWPISGKKPFEVKDSMYK
jgi:hypothetical protein